MKFIQTYFYIIIISITSGYGQSLIPQIINTSGGSSQNRRLSTEWNIGELALISEMNASNGTYILTNGFIQPAEYIIQTPQKNPFFFNNTEISSANIKIYPNPTQDIIAVDFSQAYTGKINLQLFDEPGHIIYTKEISTYGLGFVEKINMKGLPGGVYTLFIKQLNIVSGKYDSITGSYKIIKLQ